MTEREFITWLKGFIAAANTYDITPSQWNTVKQQLNKVTANIPVEVGGYGYTTTTTYDKLEDKTLLHD